MIPCILKCSTKSKAEQVQNKKKPDQQYRSIITKLVRAVAVIDGATRVFWEKALMLGLIEAVMFLIAAFVALENLGPILSLETTEEEN